jgi:ATP-dependent Clp protease ATP-binding subunit ClpB
LSPADPGKFIDKAWEAIVKSQEVARNYRNQQLEVKHLTITLLEEDEANTLLLERAGAAPAVLLKRLIDFVRRQPSVTIDGTIIYLGRGLDQLLDRADAEREECSDCFGTISDGITFAGNRPSTLSLFNPQLVDRQQNLHHNERNDIPLHPMTTVMLH